METLQYKIDRFISEDEYRLILKDIKKEIPEIDNVEFNQEHESLSNDVIVSIGLSFAAAVSEDIARAYGKKIAGCFHKRKIKAELLSINNEGVTYKIHTSSQQLELFKNAQNCELELPYADLGVSAGFPSPAQDYLQISIDLNRELIKNPASTFLARVKGLSMKDAGIDDGDILIIDKSLQPLNGDIVVSYINGEFTLKTFKKEKDGIYLMPANRDYQPIKINPGDNFMIWGVVTYSIRDERIKRKYR